MKPTLEDLRKLAKEAKTWKPRHLCAMYDAESNCGISSDPVEPCTHDCNYCVGARNAAEDVANHVDYSLAMSERPTWNRRWAGADSHRAINSADSAERIASYFGGAPAVTAFANAVREFCA